MRAQQHPTTALSSQDVPVKRPYFLTEEQPQPPVPRFNGGQSGTKASSSCFREQDRRLSYGQIGYALTSQAIAELLSSLPPPMVINWALTAVDNISPRRRLRFDEFGDPLNIHTAKTTSWTNWRQALVEEWEAHQKNGTFQFVSRDQLPQGASVISSRWVFKKKTLPSGLNRFKARLVIRGFLQLHGIDYETTYAPTASLTTLRLLLAMAVYFGWAIWNIDFVTAFLNGFIDEDIYMDYPEGLDKITDYHLAMFSSSLSPIVV